MNSTFNNVIILETGSRNSSVGIMTDYWVNGRGIAVEFLARAREYSPHSVQTDYEAQDASYPMGTGCTFPLM
jgi:hypothetical protein